MNKKDYLELANKRKKAQKLIELNMPSGAVWKVRPLNVQQYAVTGKLPLHILAGATDLNNVSGDLQSKLSGDDVVGIYGMARDALFNNVIEPRVTLIEEEDSITPEMIDPEDFDFFTLWAISGGQVKQNSFREAVNGQNGTAAPGVDSEDGEILSIPATQST